MTHPESAEDTINIFTVSRVITDVRIEAIKRLDDAIYRLKNDTDVTAADLWDQLRIAQSSNSPESAYTCMGILNQLKARRQITDW